MVQGRRVKSKFVPPKQTGYEGILEKVGRTNRHAVKTIKSFTVVQSLSPTAKKALIAATQKRARDHNTIQAPHLLGALQRHGKK